MAEASEPGNRIIPWNEETQELDESLQGALQPVLGNEIMPVDSETQITLPSPGNGSLVAPNQSEVVVTGGNYVQPVFGPQTNKKVLKANDYRKAKITNIHHHHYPATKGSEESTSSETGARPKQSEKPNLEEGAIQISDDLFMYSNKPLREGKEVFEGYQLHASGHKRPLAIKRIVPCEDKHLREVEHLLAMALTSHPNVVQIIQSKEVTGHVRILYIAMELCNSKNLQDYVNENDEKNTPLDFDKTMSHTKQLVRAIQHIHDNNIIHRDLKLENVLLSLDGRKIKVSDFGISKKIHLGKSSTNQTMPGYGTDGYRAPELFKSKNIGQSADIFSLGAVMYSMWSNGKHPFGNDIHLLNYNIIHNKGRDLSGLLISGTKENQLRDLINWMLNPEPKKRPTIEQVAQHPFFKNVASSEAGPNGNPNLSQLAAEQSSPEIPANDKTLTDLLSPDLKKVTHKEGIVIFDKTHSEHLQLFNLADGTLKQMQSCTVTRGFSYSTATLDDYIYVLMKKKSVHRIKYSNGSTTWEQMPDTIADHGRRPPATVMSGCICVAGGSYPTETNAVEKFDPSLNKWISLEKKKLSTTRNTLVVVQGFMYSIGGALFERHLREVERFDPVSSTWEFVAPMNQPQYANAAVEFKGKIFVLGGSSISEVDGGNVEKSRSSVEIYEPFTNTWSVMRKNMAKSRAYFNAFVINGDIYAVGGDDERKSIERYSSERDIWEEVQLQTNEKFKIYESTKIVI